MEGRKKERGMPNTADIINGKWYRDKQARKNRLKGEARSAVFRFAGSVPIKDDDLTTFVDGIYQAAEEITEAGQIYFGNRSGLAASGSKETVRKNIEYSEEIKETYDRFEQLFKNDFDIHCWLITGLKDKGIELETAQAVFDVLEETIKLRADYLYHHSKMAELTAKGLTHEQEALNVAPRRKPGRGGDQKDPDTLFDVYAWQMAKKNNIGLKRQPFSKAIAEIREIFHLPTRSWRSIEYRIREAEENQ